MSEIPNTPLRAMQALFSIPVLAAFVVGSLPILLPVLVYRAMHRVS